MQLKISSLNDIEASLLIFFKEKVVAATNFDDNWAVDLIVESQDTIDTINGIMNLLAAAKVGIVRLLDTKYDWYISDFLVTKMLMTSMEYNGKQIYIQKNSGLLY